MPGTVVWSPWQNGDGPDPALQRWSTNMDDAPHALGSFQRTGGTVDADGAPSPGTSGHGLPARIDPAGDFLSVYTGPLNGDLDVTAFDAVLSVPDEVVLVGTHAAPIGTTPGAAYVWGIDRGAGIELFPTLDPPTGEGVTFDAVVVLLPDGTGSLIDLVEGGVPQPLDPSSISVSGPTIAVACPGPSCHRRGSISPSTGTISGRDSRPTASIPPTTRRCRTSPPTPAPLSHARTGPPTATSPT